MLIPTVSTKMQPYDVVASEYYDAKRHPTCSNFRAASRIFLWRNLSHAERAGSTLEVGVGNSLAGEFSKEARLRFEQLILLDSSSQMLAYSSPYAYFAHLIVGNALALPFETNSISLLIASLADPFNVPSFWQEVRRCLTKGGRCLFTTPSHEWASNFRRARRDERDDAAFFQLASGEKAYLPSLIYSDAKQVELISSAGLRTVRTESIPVDAIPEPHSSKIYTCKNVVTGFVIEPI